MPNFTRKHQSSALDSFFCSCDQPTASRRATTFLQLCSEEPWCFLNLPLLQQKLMSALEEKEKDLNKLKTKVDNVLKNNHPAADKIEVRSEPKYRTFSFILSAILWSFYCFSVLVLQAYMDTLQTQWSWLLQITKCIDTHLKENAAYSQVTPNITHTHTHTEASLSDYYCLTSTTSGINTDLTDLRLINSA